MSERPFSYDIAEGSERVVLHGDLDEIAAIEMREVIGTVTESLTRDVTLDLSDLDFLPSSAVGVLAKAQDGARQQGAALSLVAADGTIAARVLAVCGLDYAEA